MLPFPGRLDTLGGLAFSGIQTTLQAREGNFTLPAVTIAVRRDSQAERSIDTTGCRVCGALLGRRQIQLDVVAGRVVQILVHSQIPLGRRQGSVAEAELDLIELGALSLSELFGIDPSTLFGV